MPVVDRATWSERVRQALARYDEPLLRQVATKLVRPRNQWPADELLERSLGILDNPAVLDRRLQEQEPEGRQLLALLGHGRQPCWPLGSLLEMLAALGHAEGVPTVFALLEAGLLFPDLGPGTGKLKSFEHWFGLAGSTGLAVFTHPLTAARALGENLELPELPGVTHEGPPREADGLEWPLRVAAVWQQVASAPLRRTQQGDYFKRDLERLQSDPVLTAPPPDQLAALPDPGLLAVQWAEAEGLLRPEEAELRAADLPACWNEGLDAALVSLWTALLQVRGWNPQEGWRGGPAEHSPYPSAYLLCLLLLARLPSETWARPQDAEDWLFNHHPYWAQEESRPSRRHPWVGTFLLGLAYPLRLVQAVQDGDAWLVRLSPLGRWLLGLAEAPSPGPTFPQTLTVQPNLEVVAYRQGLTPALVARLSRFAAWKGLGAACTLQLQPDTVYRALEGGLTFEAILQTMEQHGMRPPPPAVVESLKTWANKRERISVYPAGALFEFATAEDLNEALSRGLPAARITDRLAVVPNEGAIDYRHFRLTGTRDYALPPEKCVEVEEDGVTLGVDVARSDLLLDSELQRFAEPLDGTAVNGRRRFRVTPTTLTAGRTRGLGPRFLQDWFRQRTGVDLPPAVHLLLTGGQAPPLQFQQLLVLRVPTEELADGLAQWPGTRGLITERLGPTTLAVPEENLAELQKRFQELGMTWPG